MSIPRIVTRITNHKKPRYQFYFPGFNNSNCCWLDGGWVNVSKEEYEKNKDAHQAEYGDVRDLSDQNDRHNPGIPESQMTSKQRRAWELFSGRSLFYATKDGHTQRICLELSGNEISESSRRWMKNNGWVLADEEKTNG